VALDRSLGGSPTLRGAATLALAACLTAFAGTDARANGRFPAVDQLVAEPGNPAHLVLRATFGVLASRDGGRSWDFLCETALGYKDYDPALAVLPGGTILLGLRNGISRSDEEGCTFAFAEGVTAPVADVSAVQGEPGTAIAVSTVAYVTTFWESTDRGATFTPLGDELPDFTATTLDAAPSNPNLIYASGLAGTTGVLLRSEDRGRTFFSFTIPGANPVHLPYIATVDPTDQDTVYVRLEGLPGKLLVTRNGGTDFRDVLTTDIPVQGFALSPDGATIVVSNPYDGTFRASRDTFEFEKIACRGSSCLLRLEDELLGCGDDFVDGYIIGSSRDEGASFERVADLGCLPGPVACGAESGVGVACPAAWETVKKQIGAGVCEPRFVPTDTACFAAGGEAGAGTGAGGDGAGPSTAGSGGVGEPPGPPPEPEPSCNCRLARNQPQGAEMPLLVGAIVLGAFRRATRRRRDRTHRRWSP